MGYRSTVYLGLENKVYEGMKNNRIEIETSTWTENGDIVSGTEMVYILDYHEFQVEKVVDGLTILRVDDIKWYDTFTSVDAVIEDVQNANELHENSDPNFIVALGEDGTCEHNNIGDWYDHVWVQHEIGTF